MSEQTNTTFTNQTKATSRAIHLFYLLPCVLTFLLLVLVFKVEEIAALFICVGIFNLLLLIGNYLSVNYTMKHDEYLIAEVIACDKKKEYEIRNNRKCLQAEYYLVTFHTADRSVEFISDSKLKVGAYINVYLNQKKNTLITEKQLKECLAKSGTLFMSILIIICFVIAALIIIIPMIGGVISSAVLWQVIFGYTICLVFILVGAISVINARKQHQSKDNCKRVSAILTDFVAHDSNDNDSVRVVYFPVYEYELNGEKCTYQSSVSSNKAQKEGTKTYLYLNKETSDIFEEVEVKQSSKLGYIFLIVGIAVLLLLLWITLSGKIVL